MTDMILRLCLIDLLHKRGKDDIINKIANDMDEISKDKPFRLGKKWAQRFYARHNFKSRVGQ